MESIAEGRGGLKSVERTRGTELDELFRQLSMAHLRAAHRLAFGILGDNEEAEDACQDAFTRAWRQRATLRDPDRFDAWFGRILLNVCRDRLRGRARTPRIVERSEETGPADPADDLPHRDQLDRALAALDQDQRTVVVLRFWLDLSVDDIADRLDVPAGTVKSRLSRAMGHLRTALEAME